MAQSFRDLTVWQKPMQLTVAIYRVTQDFPREETYGLTSQIRRAAVKSELMNEAESLSREVGKMIYSILESIKTPNKKTAAIH